MIEKALKVAGKHTAENRDRKIIAKHHLTGVHRTEVERTTRCILSQLQYWLAFATDNTKSCAMDLASSSHLLMLGLSCAPSQPGDMCAPLSESVDQHKSPKIKDKSFRVQIM